MMQMPVTSQNTDTTYPDTAYCPHMNLFLNPSKYTKHTHKDEVVLKTITEQTENKIMPR